MDYSKKLSEEEHKKSFSFLLSFKFFKKLRINCFSEGVFSSGFLSTVRTIYSPIHSVRASHKGPEEGTVRHQAMKIPLPDSPLQNYSVQTGAFNTVQSKRVVIHHVHMRF